MLFVKASTAVLSRLSPHTHVHMDTSVGRWLLWNPEVHEQLPPAFREIVWALCMSRHPRAAGSLLSQLQWDILLFIMNKVRLLRSLILIWAYCPDADSAPCRSSGGAWEIPAKATGGPPRPCSSRRPSPCLSRPALTTTSALRSACRLSDIDCSYCVSARCKRFTAASVWAPAGCIGSYCVSARLIGWTRATQRRNHLRAVISYSGP